MRTFLVVAVLVLSACSAPADPAADGRPSASAVVSAAEPGASASSPLPSPSEAESAVAVGYLPGSRVREVRRNLVQLGLAVRTVDRATCRVPAGVVVAQRPRPGVRVSTGDAVVVTVARTPAAATCVWNGPARDAVRRLHAWARGRGPAPAFVDEVRVMQGNHVALRLTAAEAQDRRSWTMPCCYAERVPLSAVGWLAAQPRLVPRDVPPYFCPVRGNDLPQDLRQRLYMSRTLVTTGAQACMEVGAVQVWVDDRGRVEAVNLLLGSP